MFEAIWLLWEMLTLAALIFYVSLALFVFWLFFEWHDVWRHQEHPVTIHERARLWPKEDPE
jgi:hypothetical protein